MGTLAPDQVEGGILIDDVVKVTDVGGGTPGLPAIDGSLLSGITATQPPANEQIAREAPGLVFLGGTLLLYLDDVEFKKEDAQWTRLFLRAGKVYDRARSYAVDASGASVRFALYDQTSPLDDTLGPNAKVAETALTGVPGDAQYFTFSFVSAFAVVTTGYYWLSIVSSKGKKYAGTSKKARPDFLPRREADLGSTTFPALAPATTNPKSAVVFAALVEQ